MATWNELGTKAWQAAKTLGTTAVETGGGVVNGTGTVAKVGLAVPKAAGAVANSSVKGVVSVGLNYAINNPKKTLFALAATTAIGIKKYVDRKQGEHAMEPEQLAQLSQAKTDTVAQAQVRGANDAMQEFNNAMLAAESGHKQVLGAHTANALNRSGGGQQVPGPV